MGNFYSFLIFGGFLGVSAFALFKVWTDRKIERQEKLNAFEQVELAPIMPDEHALGHPQGVHAPHHPPESLPHSEHSGFNFGGGHHH